VCEPKEDIKCNQKACNDHKHQTMLCKMLLVFDDKNIYSKLLAQFMFKVSTFRFNTRTKTRAPLCDCRINNALIQFVPSCPETQMQFIDVLDPPFSDVACKVISYLVVGIFMLKKQHRNKVLPFDARGSDNYASQCRLDSISPLQRP